MTQETKLPTVSVYHWCALGLVFFSIFMSALVSRTVFERLPHLEDELAYLFQAKTYAHGHLVVESPVPRRAYWQPFVVDKDGVRFGKYTPGWSMLLAVGVILGQTWVVNAFFGGLSVALVFRLGRALFNPDVGLLAALLTAFSPMALLLNGTLMGHTTALFGVLLFVYAYWRVTRRRRALLWGIVGGVALGMVTANRPLTGVAAALPFIVWSSARLWTALFRDRAQFLSILRPLAALGACALLVSLIIPINNIAAVGKPNANLYTLVWSYDQVGFGECCGRHGHTFEKGIRHARFDLSLSAADLFGWNIGAITPEIQEHLRLEGDYYPLTGLSWVLLPFGLLAGVAWKPKRMATIALWILLLWGWSMFPFQIGDGYLSRDPTFSYLWMGVGALILLLPLVFAMKLPTPSAWTWLLAALGLAFIGAQLMYWIGSQRYSTRYFYEALGAAALLSALPLAWLIGHFPRWKLAVYGLLLSALLYGLYTYSTPRIRALYRFNMISPDIINGVEERRDGDRPVLVLVTGSDVRWRATGALMALTSPYLDSDIVVAWDYGGVRDQILDRFPDRQIIEMDAKENQAWFKDQGAPVG